MATGSINTDVPELTDEVLAKMNITRERWNEIRAQRLEREKTAPSVGAMAPDFELAYLNDRDNRVRLSQFRDDRPVALIFGSYT